MRRLAGPRGPAALFPRPLPRSYLRWREAEALALRVAVTSLPHCWPTLLYSLRAGDRTWARWRRCGPLPDGLILAALLAHGSKALLECMLALARPVRLWLHVPVQLLQVGGGGGGVGGGWGASARPGRASGRTPARGREGRSR